MFGRNVAKRLCNVKMLTYLVLSLAVGYQLKLLLRQRTKQRLIDTWCNSHWLSSCFD